MGVSDWATERRKRERSIDSGAAGDTEDSILTTRGQRAMLDADLAGFYGATKGRLDEQVRRSADARFQADCMFQTASEEAFKDRKLRS